MTDVSRQTQWRKSNPEKAEVQSERSAEKRRERMAADPDFAESKRRNAREAMAARQRRREAGGPDGWLIVVRMVGEKRGRAIVSLVYTEDGRIRGLKRKQASAEQPQAWETREEAQAVAKLLLDSFPTKIESAREDVV